MQTLIAASPYADSVEDNNLRMIDWFRGNPYTFRKEDFDSLMNAPQDKMFARKFDERTDGEIIRKIHDHLLKTAQVVNK